MSHERGVWRSRGYLPHLDDPEAVQSINFRLFDSLPDGVAEELLRDPRARSDALRRQRLEEYLDAGHGACYLKEPRVARMVEGALLFFDGERYQLCAWSVMPNHVHAIIEMKPEFPLDSVLHSWKSYTSKEANKLLGREGEFWFVDYRDRYLRDQRHYENAIRYVEEGNPSVFSSKAWRERHRQR